jgi:hypothetical protein
VGTPLEVTTQRSGIPLLRTSERNDFKRCPWMWHQSWNRGLTSSRTPTWSWFGSAWHKGMEARYIPGTKRGSLLDAIGAFEEALDGEVRRVYTEGYSIDEVDIVDGRKLGEAMMRGYYRHYGKESEWEVIHTEQTFQIDVVDPADASKVLVTYAGTWDALMWNRLTKTFWVWDHKTRKSFPARWEFYDINDQAGSYLWVAPEILRHLGVFSKKDELEGLVFNAARKAMPDTRPVNPMTGKATNKPTKDHYLEVFTAKGLNIPPRATLAVLADMAETLNIRVYGADSAVQPQALFHREEIWRSPEERVKQAKRVQAEAAAMAAMRRGDLPLWKTPTEDCVRCQLFEYCSVDEQNQSEGEFFAESAMKRRDPYRDHRTDFALRGVSLASPGKSAKKKG